MFLFIGICDFAIKKTLAMKNKIVRVYYGEYSKTIASSIDPAELSRKLEKVSAGLGVRLVCHNSETFVFKRNVLFGMLPSEVISLSYKSDAQELRVASRRCDRWPFDFGKITKNVHKVLDIMSAEPHGRG